MCKSVATLISGRRVVHITSAKILTIQLLWAPCPIISNKFLPLSENDDLGSVQYFILLFLCFCVDQEN